MTNDWYMLTIVGTDKPGIVAKITQSLFKANCQLGEASMIRLGGNFTVMLMVSADADKTDLESLLQPVCENFQLKFHLDAIQSKLHDHPTPEVLITVSGADRPGIVAQVTDVLFNAGLDILDLTSDVAGTQEKPIYIMQIEGVPLQGIKALEESVRPLLSCNIDVQIKPIDILVG